MRAELHLSILRKACNAIDMKKPIYRSFGWVALAAFFLLILSPGNFLHRVYNDPGRNTVAVEVDGRTRMRILLGVLTTAAKVERRGVLRLAYGVQDADMADVTLRFVVGQPRSEEERVAVGLEVLRYGDVMVLGCEENMNHGKSFAFFDAVAARGDRYDYVMKLDDDSYVRTANLARSLAPLPREDLYYGYVLPCENQDAYAWYMAGMGYVISWDLVEWVHTSPIARNHTDGTEDLLMGEWLKAGGRGTHRVNEKPLFYDHPEFGGKCAHDLIPETILVHQVKTDQRWFHVLSFFEGARIRDAITPASSAL